MHDAAQLTTTQLDSILEVWCHATNDASLPAAAHVTPGNQSERTAERLGRAGGLHWESCPASTRLWMGRLAKTTSSVQHSAEKGRRIKKGASTLQRRVRMSFSMLFRLVFYIDSMSQGKYGS